MSKNSYISEKQQRETRKEKRRLKVNKKHSESISQIMNGEFLTKDFFMNNLLYIFFVVFLMVIMVSKGYYLNQLNNDISKEERLLRNINADYVETRAKLEEMTRRGEMIEKLKPLGLIETVNPVKVIRVKEDKAKK